MSTIGSIYRISGLATGIDTDDLVKQLMSVERIPLDKLYQKKQILEWKKEDYREITNLLRGFKDEFFDVLKPDSNMTSSTPYKVFSASSSDSDVVTATANSDAVAGTHTITVTQLAAASYVTSSQGISKELTGIGAAELDFTNANLFQLTLDGVTKTISLRDGAYASTAELISNGSQDGIQDLIDKAFGSGKIIVTDAGGGILNFSAVNSKITLTSSGSNSALGKLGFTSGVSNRLNKEDTLENIGLNVPLTFDANGDLKFSINGQSFVINKSETLNDLMAKVNNSSAGVTMSYSELDDKVTITAKTKGAGENIVFSDDSGTNFFSAINIDSSNVVAGQDAKFTLDGKSVTRNDNVVSIDGITYTLKEVAGPVMVTISQDVDTVYENIKKFVDKYNEVIEKINSELSEEKFSEYSPLTDEQKEELSEKQIELWEEKARSGLLRNDSTLEKIVYDMRKALYDTIEGVSANLSEIGINTGLYTEKGKLIIDEEKLKNAIQTNPDKVEDIFSKKSSIDYSPDLTSSERAQRYSEEGIANRLYDILQDNIRTIRDKHGQKGILLEKAGIVGDITEFNNLIDKDIDRTNEAIDNLLDRLARKEEAYYRKFTALEKAISTMNNQAMWLAQQFGTGQTT